jgi:hypothetical protein
MKRELIFLGLVAVNQLILRYLEHQKPDKGKALTKDCLKNEKKKNQIKDQENVEIFKTLRTSSKVDRIRLYHFHFPNSCTNAKKAIKRTFHKEIEYR